MKAEIVAVGTELLLGDIVNSNAARISSALAEAGVDVLFHTTVGDNVDRIAGVLAQAGQRADVVIVTGGLGPTHDDLTREALAKTAGVPLERSPELMEALKERFAAMGRQMADANLKQADVPAGAEVLTNPIGTAPGIDLKALGARFFLTPGVPAELELMLAEQVIPRLAQGVSLVSRVLKATGMGESDVADRLSEVIAQLDRDPTATIALLTSPGEVRVRITAREGGGADAKAAIVEVEDAVRSRLGDAIFGVDDETLEGAAGSLVVSKGLTLATAESVSGGMLVSRLVAVPGASKFLKAGWVAYSNEAKADLLGVPLQILEQHGAVSAECAEAMAEGARTKAGADVGVATTGEAGPDPQEEPIGTVIVAVAIEGHLLSRRFIAPGPRQAIRHWSTQAALNLLRLELLSAGDQ